MANAPEYLLNLFLNYDKEETGSQFGVYYTARAPVWLLGRPSKTTTTFPTSLPCPTTRSMSRSPSVLAATSR